MFFCGDTFLMTRDGNNPFSHVSEIFQGQAVCLNLETLLKGGKRKEKFVSLSVDANNLDIIPITSVSYRM